MDGVCRLSQRRTFLHIEMIYYSISQCKCKLNCKCNSASIEGSTSLHPVGPSSDPNKAGSRMSHPAVYRVTLRKQPLAKTLKQQWLGR